MKVKEDANSLTLFLFKPLPAWLSLPLVIVLSLLILIGMVHHSYGELSRAIFDKHPLFTAIEIAFLALIPPPVLFIATLFLRWEKLVFDKNIQIMTHFNGLFFYGQERRAPLHDVLGVYVSHLKRHENKQNSNGKGHWLLNITLSQKDFNIDTPRDLPFPDSRYIYAERENHMRYVALKLGKFLNVPVKADHIDKMAEAVTVKPSRIEEEAQKQARKPKSYAWAWSLLVSFSLGTLIGYGVHDVIQRKFERQADHSLNQQAKPAQSLRGAVAESRQNIEQLRQGKNPDAHGNLSAEQLDDLGIEPALIQRFEDKPAAKNPVEAAKNYRQKREESNNALKDLDNM